MSEIASTLTSDAGAPALPADVLASPLYNADLAPTTAAQRTWTTGHIASLWIGMAVCVTTYTLAAGLLKLGMNWQQAIFTILLGNLIVLVPMGLNGHAGAKYGIPFPVLIRASFGTSGSNVPSLARAVVACGWFGIQTWIGGAAIYELMSVFLPSWKQLAPIAGVGINAAELGCFFAFWLMNVWFIVRGTESIKWLETAAAPFLILMGVALLGWGVYAAGGSLGRLLEESERFARPSVTVSVASPGPDVAPSRWFDVQPLRRATSFRIDGGPRLDLPSSPTAPADRPDAPQPGFGLFERAYPATVTAEPKFEFADASGRTSSAVSPAPKSSGAASFWLLFWPSLTAMVGYWATVSLNIPDFTRFARSQKDQIMGQLLGLPTTMAGYSFIGIAVTCASLIAFPDVLVQEDAPWDPVKLLGRFQSPPLVVTSMIALLVATLTTNIAANVVPPANSFANLAPRRIGYISGGLITAILGVVMMPWKLITSTQGYIFVWLVGYSALLGPIAGIMIADYFVVRRARLDVPDLYREGGRYGRWNARTIAIFAVAVIPCVPGFCAEAGFVPAASVPEALRSLYTYAWFVGFSIAFVLTAALGKRDALPPSEMVGKETAA